VAAKTGFVPNAYLSLAHRPAEWRAFFAYYAAVMDGEEGLTKAERELVVVATSAVNGCLCCVVSHSAFARLQSKDRVVADQVAIDWRKADLSSRERAMIKLAETPAQVVEEDRATQCEWPQRGRDLADRRHHRLLRHVQPARPLHGHAAQHGVPPDGTGPPRGLRAGS